MQRINPPLKILNASAGSGKTFALTVHFLGLLLEHPGRYREILALTFTNKATAEMKSRILGVLEALAGGHMDRETIAYRDSLQAAFEDWGPEHIQQQADEAYRRILHDYSRFSVMTIDGFSQQVVRGFAYELGLDSAFRIELNTDKVRKDLMERLYRQLNERQELFDWVIRRILKRIDDDKPWDINRELLDLSRIMFTDDFKLLEDVVSRKGNEQLFVTVSEYNHTWLEDFVAAYQHRMRRIIAIFRDSGVTAEDLFGKGRHFLLKLESYLGDPRQLDLGKLMDGIGHLIDQPDAYQAAKKRTAVVEGLYQQLNPELSLLLDFMQESLPQYHLVLAVDTNVHYLRLLKDMADLLADWRSEHNAQLISDAQTLLARIGRTAQGDPTFIWEKIGNRYQYFLFDEFQDTSHAQWDNLQPLLINALGSAGTAGGRTNAHLIVGDVKQSIYRWRNGDFRILLQGVEQAISRAFHLRDTRPLIAKDTLHVNYRSEKNIIDFNNHVFAHLPARLQKLINAQVREAMTEADYERYWVQQALQDTIVRAYEGSHQEVPSHKAGIARGTVRVAFAGAGLPVSEYKELACRQTYTQLETWIREGRYRPGDIGILVRTNDEARLLIDYFTSAQVRGHELEIAVISGDALLLRGHASVRAIVAALYFMAYGGRSYNAYLAALVFHYAAAKNKTIDAATWFAIGETDLSVLEAILPPALLSAWDVLKRLPLAELVERLIGYLRFDEDARAVPYLMALRDVVGRFVQDGSRGLQAFLSYWEEEGQELSLPGGVQIDAVEILTIHKSKGLDYKAVMIPFCSWKLDGNPRGQVWFDMQETDYAAFERMPLAYSRSVRQSVLFAQYYQEQLYHYMDALNALYVATTRAREQLWLLIPDPLTEKDRASNNDDPDMGKQLTDMNIQDVGELLFCQLMEAPGPANLESQDPLCVSLLPAIEAEQPADISTATPPWESDAAPVQSGALPVAGLSGTSTARELALPGYPTSTLLSALLSRQDAADQEIRSKQRTSALFSNALHLLMADIRSLQDLEPRVAYLIHQGQLHQTERDQALAMVRQAWEHPQLGTWLQGDYQQVSEQGILDGQGGSWRPDKIFMGPGETIVVDFKLAPADQETDHRARIEQVKNYVSLLQQMGLPGVRGYLYYFMQNKLVHV